MQRLENEIGKPFAFEGKDIKLVVSIGSSLFCEDGTDLEVLIEKADQAMYTVKRAHKGSGNVR